MTDAKATDKEDHPLQKVEKQALKSPDTHVVQNANGQQLQAVLKANLNHHSGSAGHSDAESIQIHMGDGRIASRLSVVTENQLVEPQSIKNARSISLNELVEKQEKGKDPIARSLVGEFEQLLTMQNGPAKKAFEEKLQDKADRAYGRGQYALREPPASQTLENTPEGWLAIGRKIAQLPLEHQIQVIGGTLTAVGQQHDRDEQERSLGSLIGIVQGVGHVAENLATIADFGAALIVGNNERANTMGAECGTALGQSIVSGVKLFQAAQKYSYDIGYSGDYGKPFSDIMAVGNALNDHWSQLPPREQERVKYKFITEMIADGAIGAGAGQAIGKAKTFTEVLDAVAEHATTHGVKAFEATKKAAKTIAETVDGLMAPEYAIPGGGKMKWHDIGQIDDKSVRDNVMEMTRYFEYGKKNPIPAIRAADLAGVSKKELRHLTEEQLEARGLESIQKHYDRLFYEKYPQLKGTNIEIHHALPQTLLEEWPELFKAKEVNSIEYLRGIPNSAVENGRSVHQLLTNEWIKFMREIEHPTRKQVFAKLHELDARYGRYCTPPVK